MAIDAEKLNEAYINTRNLAMCFRHLGEIAKNAPSSEAQRLAGEFTNKISTLKALMEEGLGQD